jgi:dTDP-4-dehydrorhamnose reductase
MKVLVLGASGMLGNAMFRVLAAAPNLDVFGSLRSVDKPSGFPPLLEKRLLCGVNAERPASVLSVLETVQPQQVVNCIGLVSQLALARDHRALDAINTEFPRQLARMCGAAGIRLVQVSTDCVFSGTRGDYRESDTPDAEDAYGKSKLLGEIDEPHAITLRTSLIGRQLAANYGLLEWFLAQRGTVHGYSKAVFSGLPTVEFARVVRDHVIPRMDLSGIYHVASRPISKFALLKLIASTYGKTIKIVPDASVVTDRTLNGSRFRAATGYASPGWPTLVRHMHDFG